MQSGTYTLGKNVVPINGSGHERLLRTYPSSVPEGRQGVQSGPEIPSWRWLQHMVNFHNYSLPALYTNCHPKKACNSFAWLMFQ